jgi:anti-sigma B factor antagonist
MATFEMRHQLVRETPRVLLLELAGEARYLDLAATESYFSQALAETQPQHVLLDMAGVTFMVTPFLGSLLFWKEEVARRGGRLILCGLGPRMESLVRLVRLDRLLTLCATRDEALSQLSPGI